MSVRQGLWVLYTLLLKLYPFLCWHSLYDYGVVATLSLVSSLPFSCWHNCSIACLPFLCWHIHHEYTVVVSESCIPHYITSISVLPYPLRGFRGVHWSLGYVPHLSITLSLLSCCVDRSAMSILVVTAWISNMYRYYTVLICCVDRWPMDIWWWPLDMYPILHCTNFLCWLISYEYLMVATWVWEIYPLLHCLC